MTEHSSSPQSLDAPASVPSRAITKDELRAILAESDSAGLPGTIDDETLLVVDSYVAIWIQHVLEERHGVVVNLSGETADVDSLDGLLEVVNRASLRVGAA